MPKENKEWILHIQDMKLNYKILGLHFIHLKQISDILVYAHMI